MALLNESFDQFPTRPRWTLSWLCSVVFIMSMLCWALIGGNLTLAVYALAFWHYYLYWLAYYFGEVAPVAFKRDAILMKTFSILGLGCVYLAAPLNLGSLTLVGCGFLLNGYAASILGSNRTYYGYELSDLPREQITTFPYSWISHPMLVGNITAFGGTLVNADFRSQWWPLACGHVALNLGLLLMELAVTPQRRSAGRVANGQTGSGVSNRLWRSGYSIIAVGAVLAVALGSWKTWSTQTLLGMGAGVCILAYACAMYCCYSKPASPP